ncbi:MAG: agmatinase [Alphaproteobacteria bacterium]|nr:MAG: agmatinase [Alphaproteobacteria bacterium]
MSERQTDNAFRRSELKGRISEPTYSGALSFLRRRYSRELEGVDLAVAGVPFDLATTNRPGTRFGPRSMRQASTQLAWDPTYRWEQNPFEELNIVDYGDFYFDHAHPAAIPAAIEAEAKSILEAGPALLALGGDHFLTWPLLKAHAEKHGPLALLHFDAHTDTWEPDEESTDDINHGTMFYHAAREGIIDVENSIQVGIRTTNEDTRGFQILDAQWVMENGVAATVKAIRERLGVQKCYLTFDIDCLDPAFAPGTGTPVAGGLSSREALAVLRGLAGIHLVGMDVVEVAPAYDVGDITSLAAATIAAQEIALFAAARKIYG